MSVPEKDFVAAEQAELGPASAAPAPAAGPTAQGGPRRRRRRRSQSRKTNRGPSIGPGDKVVPLMLHPEGWTGQDVPQKKGAGADEKAILRMMNQKRLLSARIVQANPQDDEIIVQFVGPLADLKGVMTLDEFDEHRYKGYEGFCGQVVDVIALEYFPKAGTIRVSRRQARAIKREKTLAVIKPGMIVKSVVRSMQRYAAFVDIGGIHGWLGVDQIDWKHINHPSDILQNGDAVDVQILSIDRDHPGEPRVRVSRKALMDPWKDVMAAYKPEAIVLGTIVGMVGNQLYVRPEPEVGVDFLCTVQPGKKYNLNAEVRVKVVKVDPVERHLRGRIIGVVRS